MVCCEPGTRRAGQSVFNGTGAMAFLHVSGGTCLCSVMLCFALLCCAVLCSQAEPVFPVLLDFAMQSDWAGVATRDNIRIQCVYCMRVCVCGRRKNWHHI